MRMLLNGEWVDRLEHMEVRDPQDNSLVDTVPKANAADMDLAIQAKDKLFTLPDSAARRPARSRVPRSHR
jgi:glyceraldehyde-3-phosphate dehydrogenase (NADP+)